MLKVLALTVLSLATVTACTTQNATHASDYYHQQALHAASVSGGACDSAGQIVTIIPDRDEAMQMASRRQAMQTPDLAGASEPR